MNPYFYIFFKFSQFLNKQRDNEWGPIAAITFFTGQYLFIAYGVFFNINESNFSENKIVLFAIGISLFIFNSIIFLNKKRAEEIIEFYNEESQTKKNIGNFFVILYMVLPLGWILLL